MKSVDVIVPCYRYGHFLRQCVESVLTQSLQNLRVLIIDDASPDNTAEVATALATLDSRVTVLRHAVNKGHIETYNEGIEWATAEYMLLLSADDYLLPGALQRATEFMKANPAVGLTFGKAIRITASNRGAPAVRSINAPLAWRAYIFPSLAFMERSAFHNIVSSPTAVVRTAIQKRIGGYRPELPHSGDLEMWLRFALHSQVGFLNVYQGVYRRHSENMSTRFMADGLLGDLQQRKAALDYFLEHSKNTLPDADQLRDRLLRRLAYSAIGSASVAFSSGDAAAFQQCCAFAQDFCPRVRISWPWFKLACKRKLNPRAARALQTLIAKIRCDSSCAECNE